MLSLGIDMVKPTAVVDVVPDFREDVDVAEHMVDVDVVLDNENDVDVVPDVEKDVDVVELTVEVRGDVDGVRDIAVDVVEVTALVGDDVDIGLVAGDESPTQETATSS